MELTEKNFKVLKYGMWVAIFAVLLSVALNVYGRLFSQDKIALQLEESNKQIANIIEINRKIEQQLLNTKQEINRVHRSLLESQVKLTELIKDSKGSTSILKEKTKGVQDDLNKAIDDIDKILTENIDYDSTQ